MLRKFVCGFALIAGLTFVVGCDKGSTAPSKTKEQLEKEQKENMDKMKGMMPAGQPSTTPAPSGK